MANILFIATGTIRSPMQLEIADQLVAEGHHVRCINTGASLAFMALHLASRPRRIPTFLRFAHALQPELMPYLKYAFGTVNHIESARWGDLIVICPATCNTIGKLTSGVTDNFAMLVVRAFHGNVLVCPSMNCAMWSDPFTQKNIAALRSSSKYLVVDPIVGTHASGEVGLGRVAPVETVLERIRETLGAASTRRPSKRAG